MRSPGSAEFITLLALMVSITALSTDIMLPALDQIGRDLAVSDPNDAQLVVSSLFLGFAVGQMLVGPLSDSFGRKPVIYGGYLVFGIGCVLSAVAQDFTTMLAGRVLQGLGAAGPRVVSTALVRDLYAGREMARIMSFIMAVFIIVPAIAPALGEGVIALGGWRACFSALLALAVVAGTWFALRQPETLMVDARRPFRVGPIARGVAEIVQTKVATAYTLVMGGVFGAFLGYLSSAQQIFQQTYGTGQWFAAWFGVAALAIGAASYVNAQMVMRLGMRLLTRWALIGTVAGSGLLLAWDTMFGTPPFWVFVAWQIPTFFCFGLLFGNLNVLAMEPLGHMAGLGAAMVGSISTIIALPIGWAIGNAYDGGITPLILGFALSGLAGLGFASLAGSRTPP
ncbi:MAG: multidrug effflux MFS transporter [Pseudomonadota bacterium]